MKLGGLRWLLPLALATAPVMVAAACYGPTQITIDLSTDIACSDKPRTAIFKGQPLESAPSATTDACQSEASADGDAEIGTLVFVPSGDRDGRARVKVTLSQGNDPATCESHRADCIEASRSFSFVEHLSSRLPIRLLKACLGKRCPDGQTCVEDGSCASDDFGGKQVGGRPVPDAQSDAPIVPTAPPQCKDPVTTFPPGVPGAQRAAFDGKTFYFDGATPTASLESVTVLGKIDNVPLTSQPSAIVAVTTAGSAGVALYKHSASDGGVVASVYDGSESVDLVGSAVLPFVAIAALPPAAGGDEIVGYASYAGGIAKWSGKSGIIAATYYNAGGNSIAVDDAILYIGNVGAPPSVYIINPTADPTQGAYGGLHAIEPLPTTGRVLFAHARDGTVLAAGKDSQTGALTIAALRGPVRKDLATVSSIVSMTADDSHVYWTDGKTIFRTPRGVTGQPETFFTPPASSGLDHLAIDEYCVYFWASDANPARGGSLARVGVLHGVPKTP